MKIALITALFLTLGLSSSVTPKKTKDATKVKECLTSTARDPQVILNMMNPKFLGDSAGVSIGVNRSKCQASKFEPNSLQNIVSFLQSVSEMTSSNGTSGQVQSGSKVRHGRRKVKKSKVAKSVRGAKSVIKGTKGNPTKVKKNTGGDARLKKRQIDNKKVKSLRQQSKKTTQKKQSSSSSSDSSSSLSVDVPIPTQRLQKELRSATKVFTESISKSMTENFTEYARQIKAASKAAYKAKLAGKLGKICEKEKKKHALASKKVKRKSEKKQVEFVKPASDSSDSSSEDSADSKDKQESSSSSSSSGQMVSTYIDVPKQKLTVQFRIPSNRKDQ